MKRILITTVTAIAALSALETATNAAIVFTYDYSGNTPGVGFLDPVSGQARRDALVTAGNLFSNLFGTHFSNSTSLTIGVFSTTTGVASAGTAGIGAPGFGNGEVIRNKVISGGIVDLNGADNDGFLFVNWANDYVIDPNAPVNFNAGQIDFFSVVDHEFTHAFGFGSNIPADGSTPGSYTKWDQFLSSKTLGPVVNPITGQVNQAAYLDAQTNGGVFNGPNATAAFANRPVPLVVDPDISHLNQDVFTPTTTTEPASQVPFNALMRPSGTAPDLSVYRAYVPAEIGILADIGYTPVPEPSTTVFGIVGVIGFLIRRTRGERA